MLGEMHSVCTGSFKCIANYTQKVRGKMKSMSELMYGEIQKLADFCEKL